MEREGEAIQLPRVLVVILAAGSPHLDACIVSVLAQDYPELEVLVVDLGEGSSADEIAASHGLPVITPPKGAGVAGGANAVLYEPLDNCEWIVFCHDEVALEPQTVRMLIEGADDAGAVIAGAKIRDWHHPEVLREIGFGVDRYGYHRSLVDPGEVDRGQHDLVRDVFFVSTACMAVDVSLFKSIGGFDPALDSLEEDLDLCWRAHLLGQKVVVVPSAVAYHDPSVLDLPPVKHRDLLAQRNRMRIITKCYRVSRLLVTLLALLVQDAAEVAFRVATGRPPRVLEKVGVWLRYLVALGPVLRARSTTQKARVVSDSDIANLQTKGSLRVRSVLERQLHREALAGSEGERHILAGTGSGMWEFFLHELTKPAVIFWVAWIVLTVLASRNLLFSRGSPVVGQIGFSPRGLAPLESYFASWHPDGVGYSGYSPTALLLAGAAQLLTAGSPTAAVKVLLPLAYLVGAAGLWANVRRISGAKRWEGAALATALYSLSAPVVASYERGSLSGIVTAALLPWAVGLVYSPVLARRGIVRHAAFLALLTFAMAAFEPLAPLFVVAAAAGVFLGSLVAGKFWRSLASVLIAVIGAGIGALLAHPSVFSESSARDLVSRAVEGWPDGRVQLGVGGVLRMHTTELGAAPFGYLLAALAFAAVVICTKERLAWVTRSLFGAAIPAAGVWLVGQGHLPPVLESFPAVFCLVALSFSLSAGLGVDELVDKAISQERLSTLARVLLWPVVAVALVAMGPGVFREVGGDLGIRRTGIVKALSDAGIGGEQAEVSVLWLGSREALPENPRPLPGGVGGAYSITGPWPSIGLAPLAPRPERFEDSLELVLSQMQSEGFTRGGKLFALLGVRYVVIPENPGTYPVGSRPLPAGIAESLSRQLDITEVRGIRGMRIFRVNKDSAVWTATSVDAPVAEVARLPVDRFHRRWLDTELTDVAPAFDSVRLQAPGTVETRKHVGVIVFKECDAGLRMYDEVQGRTDEVLRPAEALGWACLFDVRSLPSHGDKLRLRLGYEDISRQRTTRWLPVVGIAVLLVVAATAHPRRRDEHVPERLAALGIVEDFLEPSKTTEAPPEEASAPK